MNMWRAAVRLLALVLVCATPAILGPVVQAERADPPRGAVDFAQDPGREMNPGPVPQPRPLPPTPLMGDGEIQLVGFTGRTLAGNKGVLNYTLACQADFPGSRMCTVDEVRQSFHVPRVFGVALAWVRNEGTLTLTASGGSGPSFENGRARERAVTDCRGWISRSPQDFGTAMDMGPESACYGGFWAASCDQELAVACCARMP